MHNAPERSTPLTLISWADIFLPSNVDDHSSTLEVTYLWTPTRISQRLFNYFADLPNYEITFSRVFSERK